MLVFRNRHFLEFQSTCGLYYNDAITMLHKG